MMDERLRAVEEAVARQDERSKNAALQREHLSNKLEGLRTEFITFSTEVYRHNAVLESKLNRILSNGHRNPWVDRSLGAGGGTGGLALIWVAFERFLG